MPRYSKSQYFLMFLLFLGIVALLIHINHTQKYSSPKDSQESPRRNFINEPTLKDQAIVVKTSPTPTPLMLTKLSSTTWTLDTIRDQFFAEVNRAHVKCESKPRLGEARDGGYEICSDKGYAFEPGCLTYTFGVGDFWKFEEQVAQRYNCTVRAFDPTLKLSEHVHKPGPVHFYPIGIGDGSKVAFHKYKTQTFGSFLKRFGEENKVIDLLKIDVEYSEWHSLKNIMEEGLLKRVKQLTLELHTKELIHRRSEVKDYRYYLKILQQLEKLGFRKYQAKPYKSAIIVFQRKLTAAEKSIHKLKRRSCCHEVFYLNLAYMPK